MRSQLGPILQQLAGVDLDECLRGIAALPGAAATNMARPGDTDRAADQA